MFTLIPDFPMDGGRVLRAILSTRKNYGPATQIAASIGQAIAIFIGIIKFIRSIPLSKAMDSTLLVYEMNGQPLLLEHGYPLRSLALGWTGANCVKWLYKITLLEQPFEGFFMDNVYRVFQKGEDPKTGEVVKDIHAKSIIVEPETDQTLPAGIVPVRGAAYAGEAGIEMVEVSVDQGNTWHPAELVGPEQPYAWRHWEYLWEVNVGGDYRIMARATDTDGRPRPPTGMPWATATTVSVNMPWQSASRPN